MRTLFFLALILFPSISSAQITQINSLIQFQLRDKYMIVVPVTVNGAGPFQFLLDTGSAHTLITPTPAFLQPLH